MSNGITISKDAFLNAGKGSLNAKRDVQREMLFDAINDLATVVTSQKELCNGEFASKKDVKWLTWGFRGMSLVIATGVVAFIFNLIKDAIAK